MQMAFKLDGKHDIRGLQPTSMDTAHRPPAPCWLRYARPVLSRTQRAFDGRPGGATHHTSGLPVSGDGIF